MFISPTPSTHPLYHRSAFPSLLMIQINLRNWAFFLLLSVGKWALFVMNRIENTVDIIHFEFICYFFLFSQRWGTLCECVKTQWVLWVYKKFIMLDPYFAIVTEGKRDMCRCVDDSASAEIYTKGSTNCVAQQKDVSHILEVTYQPLFYDRIVYLFLTCLAPLFCWLVF